MRLTKGRTISAGGLAETRAAYLAGLSITLAVHLPGNDAAPLATAALALLLCKSGYAGQFHNAGVAYQFSTRLNRLL